MGMGGGGRPSLGGWSSSTISGGEGRPSDARSGGSGLLLGMDFLDGTTATEGDDDDGEEEEENPEEKEKEEEDGGGDGGVGMLADSLADLARVIAEDDEREEQMVEQEGEVVPVAGVDDDEDQDMSWACDITSMRLINKVNKEAMIAMLKDFGVPTKGTKEELAALLAEQLHYETDDEDEDA